MVTFEQLHIRLTYKEIIIKTNFNEILNKTLENVTKGIKLLNNHKIYEDFNFEMFLQKMNN